MKNYGHTQVQVDYAGYKHDDQMTSPMHAWLARPARQCRVVKAVEESEILGWVVWAARGVEFDDDGFEQGSQHTVEKPADGDERGYVSVQVETTNGKRGVQRLRDITDSKMCSFTETVMLEGTRSFYVIAISIAPEHQRKGMGRALMRYGTARADRESVFCWVSSCDGGRGAFVKEGFDEADKLTLDLDAFAAEQEEEEEKANSDSQELVVRLLDMVCTRGAT